MKRYREAELTHGRVCMLASIGMLTGEAVEPNAPFFNAQITGASIRLRLRRITVGVQLHSCRCSCRHAAPSVCCHGIANQNVIRSTA